MLAAVAIVAAFETSLILYAEHGFNASACAARVVTSTRSDTYSAVTAALGAVAELRDGQRLLDIYETLARAMYEAKEVRPNVHYPAGPAYHLMGFDTPAFTPIFAAARLPGWAAHIAEQSAS